MTSFAGKKHSGDMMAETAQFIKHHGYHETCAGPNHCVEKNSLGEYNVCIPTPPNYTKDPRTGGCVFAGKEGEDCPSCKVHVQGENARRVPEGECRDVGSYLNQYLTPQMAFDPHNYMEKYERPANLGRPGHHNWDNQFNMASYQMKRPMVFDLHDDKPKNIQTCNYSNRCVSDSNECVVIPDGYERDDGGRCQERSGGLLSGLSGGGTPMSYGTGPRTPGIMNSQKQIMPSPWITRFPVNRRF